MYAIRSYYAEVKVGQTINRNQVLHQLVDALYSRNEVDFQRGNFRVKGDTVDIFLAYDDKAIRLVFWGDEIEEIYSFDPVDRITSYNVCYTKLLRTS